MPEEDWSSEKWLMRVLLSVWQAEKHYRKWVVGGPDVKDDRDYEASLRKDMKDLRKLLSREFQPQTPTVLAIKWRVDHLVSEYEQSGHLDIVEGLYILLNIAQVALNGEYQ